MSKVLRMVVWTAVAAAIAALGVLLFRPPPIRVDFGHVQRGPMRVTIDAEGKTRIKQRYIISAPVAGRLTRITVDEGDIAEREAVVARIDPLPHDAAVQAAQARLAELRARRDGSRYPTTQTTGLITGTSRH